MGTKKTLQSVCIGLEITKDCNMNCPYCYVKPRKSKKELSIKEWVVLTDLLADFYKDYRLSFHLAGGEIFIKKNICQLIEQIIKKKCFASVVSNGLALPEEIFTSPFFKKNRRFLQIAISMDGLKSEHEKTRYRFARVLKNFERLLENNISTLIKVTLHKENYKKMIDFNHFMNEVGEKYNQKILVEFQPLSIGPRKEVRKDIKSFQQMKIALKNYLETALEVSRYTAKNLTFVKNDWRFIGEVLALKKRPHKELSFESAYFGCSIGHGFDIMANGDIVLCEMDVPVDNIQDGINKKNLKRIIDKLDEKRQPNKRCFHCPYHSLCGMCRIPPTIHGYTEGFGYQDCLEFMKDISQFYDKNIWKKP